MEATPAGPWSIAPGRPIPGSESRTAWSGDATMLARLQLSGWVDVTEIPTSAGLAELAAAVGARTATVEPARRTATTIKTV